MANKMGYFFKYVMRIFAFDIKISFQINSFLLVYEGVRTTINDQVGWLGIYGKGHLGVGFLTWVDVC